MRAWATAEVASVPAELLQPGHEEAQPLVGDARARAGALRTSGFGQSRSSSGGVSPMLPSSVGTARLRRSAADRRARSPRRS